MSTHGCAPVYPEQLYMAALLGILSGKRAMENTFILMMGRVRNTTVLSDMYAPTEKSATNKIAIATIGRDAQVGHCHIRTY
jgi:hypothetical protein